MSWLDDLRDDPDVVHRETVRVLYERHPAVIASFGRPLYRYTDRDGQTTAFVETGALAPLLLLPPALLEEQIDELVLVCQGGEYRVPFCPASCQPWRHVIALYLPSLTSSAGTDRTPSAPSPLHSPSGGRPWQRH